MKALTILSIVWLLVFSVSLNAAEVGETINFDLKTPHPYPQAEAGTRVWTDTIYRTDASWIKPHFTKFKLNDEDYVILYDMYGTPVEKIYGSEVMDVENSRFKVTLHEDGRVEFWGPMIDGNEVKVELYRGAKSRKGYGFEIDQAGTGYIPIDEIDPNLNVIQSICGTDDKVDIKCAATAQQTLGMAVGRMLFQVKRKWYVCTGFLISSCSSHFLTNEHCITSQAEVDTLQVRFKYRYTTCGGSTLDSYVTYYGSTYVTDSSTYDYCLLTLQGSPQDTYGHLTLLNRAPVLNEDIYIIQHPGGNPQQIGYGDVYSTTANNNLDLGYMVDTEGGSSGSPVFADSEDEVVGLHHYGGCPNSGVKMDLIYESIIGYICN